MAILMLPYDEILVGPRARRQLRRIASKDRLALASIERAIGSLAAWPDSRQVRPLSSHESQYRLRTGR